MGYIRVTVMLGCAPVKTLTLTTAGACYVKALDARDDEAIFAFCRGAVPLYQSLVGVEIQPYHVLEGMADVARARLEKESVQ
jgi:hypothetical protein